MALKRGYTHHKQSLIPYSFAGAVLFSAELFALWVIIDYTNIPYLYATGPIFFIAVTTHFYISRRFAFTTSTVTPRTAYVRFLFVALFGAVLVSFAMSYLVENTAINALYARAIIATCTGLATFFAHRYFTFGIR